MTFKKFLSENSMYVDATTRNTLLNNKPLLRDALYVNFLGILGIAKISSKRGDMKSYFHDDLKLQIASISDGNKDISLVIKLANEAGIVKTTTANQVTKFLYLLKNKTIKGEDILDDTIRSFVRDFPYASQHPSAQIKQVVDDFLAGKFGLKGCAKEFRLIVGRNKDLKAITQEFQNLAKQFTPYFAGIDTTGTGAAQPTSPKPLVVSTPPSGPDLKDQTKTDDKKPLKSGTTSQGQTHIISAPVAPQEKKVSLSGDKLYEGILYHILSGKEEDVINWKTENNVGIVHLSDFKIWFENHFSSHLNQILKNNINTSSKGSDSYKRVTKVVELFPVVDREEIWQIIAALVYFKVASLDSIVAADSIFYELKNSPLNGLTKFSRFLKERLISNLDFMSPGVAVGIFRNLLGIDVSGIFQEICLVADNQNRILTEKELTSYHSLLFRVGANTEYYQILSRHLVKHSPNIYGDVVPSNKVPSRSVILTSNFKYSEKFPTLFQFEPGMLDPKSNQAIEYVWNQINRMKFDSSLFELTKNIFELNTDKKAIANLKLALMKGFDDSDSFCKENIFWEDIKEVWDGNDLKGTRMNSSFYCYPDKELDGQYWVELLKTKNFNLMNSSVTEASRQCFSYDNTFMENLLELCNRFAFNIERLKPNPDVKRAADFIAKLNDKFTINLGGWVPAVLFAQGSISRISSAYSSMVLGYIGRIPPNEIDVDMRRSILNSCLRAIILQGKLNPSIIQFEKDDFDPEVIDRLQELLKIAISDLDGYVIEQVKLAKFLDPESESELISKVQKNIHNPNILNPNSSFGVEVYLNSIKSMSRKYRVETLIHLLEVVSDLIENKEVRLAERKHITQKVGEKILEIFDDEQTPDVEKATLFDAISPKLLQGICKVKVSEGMLEKAMGEIKADNCPIKPLIDLDMDRLREVLKYNKVKAPTTTMSDVRKIKTFQDLEKVLATSDKIFDDLNVEEIVPSSDDEMKIKTVELDTFNKGRHGNIGPKILKEFKVSIPKQVSGYNDFTTANPGTKILSPAFHGTGSIGASMILRYGFVVLKKGATGVVGRMLGDGIYISNVIDKVSQYLGDDGYSRNIGMKGYIFVLKAALGNRGFDYEEAGTGRDSIRSPEWCVFDANKQLCIEKAYLVELVNRDNIKQLKVELEGKMNISESSFEVRSFSEFLNEGEESIHATTFIFQDGRIPTSRTELKDFEEVDLTKFKGKVRLEYSGMGPMLIIDSSETRTFCVHNSFEYMNSPEFEDFASLVF